jgi:hypothetical protein
MSALLSDMTASIMERAELVSIFFSHALIVKGIRPFVQRILLDFHQYLVNGRIQGSPFIYGELVILCGFFCFGPILLFLALFFFFSVVA